MPVRRPAARFGARSPSPRSRRPPVPVGTPDFLRTRRYSRFVTLMKVALPLIAMGLIAAIAVWPSLRSVGENLAQQRLVDQGRTEVVDARFYSRDENNRPYSVTSESAVQVAGNDNLVDLMRPTAEFTQAGGSWVTMRADRGLYDQNSGLLQLYDNVHVLRDDGLEFTTTQADVDTENGTARGDEPVDGQGPSGEIKASGFRIFDHGDTVVFTRGSEARIAGQSQTEEEP